MAEKYLTKDEARTVYILGILGILLFMIFGTIEFVEFADWDIGVYTFIILIFGLSAMRSESKREFGFFLMFLVASAFASIAFLSFLYEELSGNEMADILKYDTLGLAIFTIIMGRVKS